MIIFLALEYIDELVGNITSKTGLKKQCQSWLGRGCFPLKKRNSRYQKAHGIFSKEIQKRCVKLELPGQKGRSQLHRRLHINFYNIMASMILDGERTTGNDVREQNGELYYCFVPKIIHNRFQKYFLASQLVATTMLAWHSQIFISRFISQTSQLAYCIQMFFIIEMLFR